MQTIAKTLPMRKSTAFRSNYELQEEMSAELNRLAKRRAVRLRQAIYRNSKVHEGHIYRLMDAHPFMGYQHPLLAPHLSCINRNRRLVAYLEVSYNLKPL